jgi:hypothetical protein
MGYLVLDDFGQVAAHEGINEIQLLQFTQRLHMPTRRPNASGGTGSPFRSCRYAFYERHMMKKYTLAMAAFLAAVATPVLACAFRGIVSTDFAAS